MEIDLDATLAYGHHSRVFDLQFHPSDSGLLASCSEDGSSRVWAFDAGACSWEQVACCSGHTSEVLRVAWSPDGARLATGGADGVVKLWRWSSGGDSGVAGGGGGSGVTGGGAPGATRARSYCSEEVAAFRGHPEEVYALQFIPSMNRGPASGTQNGGGGASGASGADSRGDSCAGGGSGSADAAAGWLVAGSGESLFLWDLSSGRMVHEAVPPRQPEEGSSSSGGSGAAAGSERAGDGPAANGHGGAAAAGERGPREGGAFPPYVFALAAQPRQGGGGGGGGGGSGGGAGDLLATACCDGAVRLWLLAEGRLEFAGQVQAHAGGMGSACAFSPSRPRLLASLSKGGELALVDTASAGLAAPAGGPAAAAEAAAAPRVLWRRQLAGPVFGCAWLAAGALGCDAEQLAVVGADCAVRLYEAGKKDADAGAAAWDDPWELPMPLGYEGRLLAAAISSDGRRLAAAGEAAPVQQLAAPRPAAAPAAAAAAAAAGGGAAGPSGGGLAGPAAAAVAGAVGRRRRGQKGGIVALDALAKGDAFEQLSIQEPPRQATGCADEQAAAGIRAPIHVFWPGQSLRHLDN